MTTYFISRHPGAIEWARRHALPADCQMAHLEPDKVQPGDTVIGSLPVNLAAQVCAAGAVYVHLSLELPAHLRGQELSADQLDALGAQLQCYEISPVDFTLSNSSSVKENTMPKLIISTCGTSILSNGAPETTRKLLISHANARTLNDIPETDRPAIEAHVQNQLASFIAAPDLAALRKQSAELNGIISLYGGVLQGKQDEHILLTTDTWLGEQGASAIASILQSKGFTASNVKRVPGLRTDSVEDFRAAMSDVVRWAVETLPGYKAQGYEVLFNLVGGFKAVQGFMQTLGTLHADRCVYLFEGTSELITLPRLPLKMDSESWVRENLGAFRRMNKNLPVLVNKVRNVPELFLFTIDGEATLSEWGQLVWSEAMDAMYKVEIHPSPSAKLVFGTDFLSSVNKLSPYFNRILNNKIDDLAYFLETGLKTKSLDFKDLKMGYLKGSNYEIDAWNEGAAKRLFGHFDPQDKAIFVLDRLDAALH